MSGEERIHERLEIRPPPLRERVADFPLCVCASGRIRGAEPLRQAGLEGGDLGGGCGQVVAGQLEEGVGDLQHEDVRVVVLVADEDPLAGAPHPVRGVVLFEAGEARGDGGVFFRLGFFRGEDVVGERVEG